MSSFSRKLLHSLAWAGYFARGIILLLLGYFLLKAAIQLDPSEVGDTDTAFDFIGFGVVGHTLFVLVALGTIAYGFFMGTSKNSLPSPRDISRFFFLREFYVCF